MEEEGDVLVASGLVDDLLDLALEYQVSSAPTVAEGSLKLVCVDR